jgi:ABC-type transporter Mla subunit MlaD
MFIGSAYEALDTYRKLFVPFVSDLDRREEKLNRLLNGVRAFSDAVNSLDEDTRDLIEQAQWAELGGMEFPEFARTLAAADWALVTSNAAERLLSEIRKRKRSLGALVLTRRWMH